MLFALCNEKGKQGDPALARFLGINDKYILWKQGANGAWQNLLEIEKIRGPKGEKPVFSKVERYASNEIRR